MIEETVKHRRDVFCRVIYLILLHNDICLEDWKTTICSTKYT